MSTSKTSNDVKQRYIDKEYKQWSVRLRNNDFDIIEEIREKLSISRADLLKMLISEKYNIKFQAKKEFKQKK